MVFVLNSLETKSCLMACTGQAPHWVSALMKSGGFSSSVEQVLKPGIACL